MLQALLHRKLTSEEQIAISANKEDSCTSSVFGVLQYLPDDLLINILKDSCGNLTSFPDDIGRIQEVLFWKKFYSAHLPRVRQKYVEPDVIIETENYSIIIEAKKYDGIRQQDFGQWEREILVVEDYYKRNKITKGIIFIAVGGTEHSKIRDHKLTSFLKKHQLHITSWISLSDAIHKAIVKIADQEELDHQWRLLKDADKALKHFGHFKTIWLNTLPNIKISPLDNKSLYYRWKTYDNKKLEDFYKNHNKIIITEINQLWKPNL